MNSYLGSALLPEVKFLLMIQVKKTFLKFEHRLDIEAHVLKPKCRVQILIQNLGHCFCMEAYIALRTF